MGTKKGERFFKTDCITVKKIDGGEIIFYDRQTIYLYQDGARYGSVFTNWAAPRGAYATSWKKFRERLVRRKHLTVRNCYELALKYDIVAISAYTRVDLEGKKVRTIYG